MTAIGYAQAKICRRRRVQHIGLGNRVLTTKSIDHGELEFVSYGIVGAHRQIKTRRSGIGIRGCYTHVRCNRPGVLQGATYRLVDGL